MTDNFLSEILSSLGRDSKTCGLWIQIQNTPTFPLGRHTEELFIRKMALHAPCTQNCQHSDPFKRYFIHYLLEKWFTPGTYTHLWEAGDFWASAGTAGMMVTAAVALELWNCASPKERINVMQISQTWTQVTKKIKVGEITCWWYKPDLTESLHNFK